MEHEAVVMMGQSMTDAPGRAKLANQLREEADRLIWAAAVMKDAAKVLETESLWAKPLVWPTLPTD